MNMFLYKNVINIKKTIIGIVCLVSIMFLTLPSDITHEQTKLALNFTDKFIVLGFGLASYLISYYVVIAFIKIMRKMNDKHWDKAKTFVDGELTFFIAVSLLLIIVSTAKSIINTDSFYLLRIIFFCGLLFGSLRAKIIFIFDKSLKMKINDK